VPVSDQLIRTKIDEEIGHTHGGYEELEQIKKERIAMTGRHPKPFTKADPPSQTVDPRFGGHRYRCTSIDGRVPRERRCSSDRFGTCARLDRPCSLGTMGIRPRLLGGDQSSIVRASAISPSSTAGMGGTLCATPERWRMRPEARLGPIGA
jgi:hypothetical protein